MRTPFRKGVRVVIANDMMMIAGRVTDPKYDLGEGKWGVWVMIHPQPQFDDFVRDTGQFQCEVDVCHAHGVFKGYTGPSKPEPDGSMEVFVVPQ